MIPDQEVAAIKEAMEKAKKAYRKDKYVALTNTGYHKLFVMPSNNQNDTEELWDDIKEGSSRAEITRTFKKMFKNKIEF